jgi:hypothetical protein
MSTKSMFFSIPVLLVLLFLVGCGNAVTTPVSEAPAATPTEETVVIEKSDTDGPRTGDTAPDFTLPDSEGNMVRLSDELKDNRFVVLVFYHSQF